MTKAHWLLAFGLTSIVAVPALAASTQVEACKAEFKNAGCAPTNEAEAYTCIEGIEKEGQKDEGLSHACYEAHERYEKKMHKQEHHEHEDK
ncbi:MAG: hypothetical protein QM778_29050 [Myxococcales bacterium]